MKTFLYPVLSLVLLGAGCNRTPSSVDAAGAPEPKPRIGYAEATGDPAAKSPVAYAEAAGNPAARLPQRYADEIPSGTVVQSSVAVNRSPARFRFVSRVSSSRT
jgi:hypothetical protein